MHISGVDLCFKTSTYCSRLVFNSSGSVPLIDLPLLPPTLSNWFSGPASWMLIIGEAKNGAGTHWVSGTPCVLLTQLAIILITFLNYNHLIHYHTLPCFGGKVLVYLRCHPISNSIMYTCVLFGKSLNGRPYRTICPRSTCRAFLDMYTLGINLTSFGVE